MTKKEFVPGVVFREHLKHQSDKGDPSLYHVIAVGHRKHAFGRDIALEIHELGGNKMFTGIVLRDNHFMAMMFVMGEAVVINVRYENLERVIDAEWAIKRVTKSIKK